MKEFMKNNNLFKREKIYLICIIGIVIISLIPLFMISQYNHPSADDYDYAITTYHCWNNTRSIIAVLKEAFWTSVRFWNSWQGLYSSAFLLSLQPAIFGEHYYVLTGIFMISVIILGNIVFFTYMMRRVFKNSWLESISLAFASSFLMIQWMPSCVEGIFWYNGAVNYGFFFLILIIQVCLLIELIINEKKKKNIVLLILCSLNAFFLEGGNHITALMGVVFTVALLIVLIVQKNNRKAIEMGSILLVKLVSLGINLGSPGTAIRQSNFSEHPNLIKTIYLAMNEAIKNVSEWLDFSAIVVVIVMLPVLIAVVCNIKKITNFKFSYPMLVVVGSVAWLAIMYCPPIYAMGTTGEGRLQNVVYYNFVILLFANVVYLVGWIMNKLEFCTYKKESLIGNSWIVSILILCFALTLSGGESSWGKEAWREIRTGEARQYSIECDERYEVLIRSTGEHVAVPEYSIQPEVLFFSDIENDYANWKNLSVAEYYGLQSIFSYE